MDDIILDVLGDSPRIRILCVLLNGYDVAKPVEDISEYADLNLDVVTSELDEFETWGVAEETDDGWRCIVKGMLPASSPIWSGRLSTASSSSMRWGDSKRSPGSPG